mmetsp:Transcript_58212/g.165526  ORF Transcript_58212/g.165526 Transcript_58212/m.165526 type:complete len:283 (+) Transcript_58212:55-903(+)|eukprot:CAMPEP_0168402190 /NCGR_PEP_ID=MMETSP0228-20121227/23493_1 /TAXON_ID=133427 /ORGANISM="Protoceratium reticulatum, Strain CCCM 535 (=CCMP 1889)" /LENGTH=282 /DNA_ID=CAMNT_0008415769 /DNA_START=21 /DNA_END=869 /DNA_ORIENTATION=+
MAGWALLPHHEGDATIASRSAENLPVKFFGNWRCPYTQRVWIGLEEKVVDYQWTEIDPYAPPVGGSTWSQWRMGLDELGALYPAFVASSPRGQLPALDNDGEHVQDSLILLEYVHEAFRGPPLLPTTPYLRAQVRLWTRHVDLHVVPHFERLLSTHDPQSRDQERQALLQGLIEFQSAMAPETEGPFFLGDDFTMADIALAPWWQRMCTVLRAYRKFDPSACPRLEAWFEAVAARPSFQRTVVDPERLIEEFSYCADIEESTKLRRGPLVRNSRALLPMQAH